MNIVGAIKEGDQVVFQQVFSQYYNKLYYYIFAKTKSEYLSEEVVQIAFIKLWERRHSLNEEFTISTQIFRIATTSLIDLLRQHNAKTALLKDLECGVTASANNHSVDRLQEKELHQKLSFIINSLPPVRRKVFEMSRLSGLSYREIAQELSISTKTVENHISKALKQIRKCLQLLILLLGYFKGL